MFSLKNKRKTATLLLIGSGLMFLFLFGNNNDQQVINVSQESDIKYILFWTKMFKSDNFYFPKTGSELFEDCEYSNCFATNNKTLLPVEDFAAVLFYCPVVTHDIRENETLPARRSPHQRYIFTNMEVPVRFYGADWTQYVYDHFYNWTMTYRTDSDVVRSRGYFVEADTDYNLPPREYFTNKTGTVAWVVSNCNSITNKRDELAKKLSKYVKLDIYGKCGDKECTEDCFDMIERNYKFYLAFENSYCKDYATEKLFGILQRNLIPIVYGGGDYENISPPNSVINVEDFENVEELAYLINYLNENLDDYLEYFEWKKHYEVRTGSTIVACKLCEMLNNPNLPPKVYEDIQYWWFSEEMSQCKVGDDLPRIAFS